MIIQWCEAELNKELFSFWRYYPTYTPYNSSKSPFSKFIVMHIKIFLYDPKPDKISKPILHSNYQRDGMNFLLTLCLLQQNPKMFLGVMSVDLVGCSIVHAWVIGPYSSCDANDHFWCEKGEQLVKRFYSIKWKNSVFSRPI